MGWILDPRFDLPENAEVFGYLRREGPSAHSDVATVLIESARAMPDVRSWCPDPAAYAFVALATRRRRIFALARSMSGIVFALPAEEHAAALADGGRTCPEIGSAWIEWSAFSAKGLARWCKQAHDHAARADSSAK